MLREFVDGIAFRHTTTSLIRVADRGRSEQEEVVFLDARVKADTTEPARPAGKVQFYLDGEKIEPAKPLLPAGIAKLALKLGPGRHTVTAVYTGDNFYNPSKSELAVTR